MTTKVMSYVAAVLVAFGAATSVLAHSPASYATNPAEDNQILISKDGQHFSRTMPFALFEDAGRVVPSDVRRDTAWVKNDSPHNAMLHVQFFNVSDNNSALAKAATLQVGGVDSVQGPAITLADAKSKGCFRAVSDIALAPHQAVQISATLTVSDTLGQNVNVDGALGTVNFQMQAVMVEAAAASSDVSTDCLDVGADVLGQSGAGVGSEGIASPVHPSESTSLIGGLAFTGAPLTWQFYAVAAGSVGVGVWIVLMARRRKEEQDGTDFPANAQ